MRNNKHDRSKNQKPFTTFTRIGSYEIVGIYCNPFVVSRIEWLGGRKHGYPTIVIYSDKKNNILQL